MTVSAWAFSAGALPLLFLQAVHLVSWWLVPGCLLVGAAVVLLGQVIASIPLEAGHAD